MPHHRLQNGIEEPSALQVGGSQARRHPALGHQLRREVEQDGGVDLAAMDRLWLHGREAHCVHPGGDALSGWDAVRKSWEQIFSSTRWLRVTPTGVRVEVLGEVAVVTCAVLVPSTS